MKVRTVRPSVLCLLSSVLCLLPATGCTRPKPAARAGTQTVSKGPQTDEALAAARDIFRKEVGLKSYRNALQKLNTYAARHPDERPAPLSDEQRDLLVRQIGLEEDELAEINSNTFTLLDAHYLDQCFLMRDAVRSLGVQELPPLQQLEKAFAWVTRQVRLQGETGEPLPPHFVLRRGWGTSLERALVFLAMAQQMGLEGCILSLPPDSGQGFARFWLPGVLVDGQIYLFDTRLGFPLPSPQGDGPATLEQVRTSDQPFHKLALDDKHHYDVTKEAARKAEIHLGWSLSALAPRMKYLQELLASYSRISLSADPAGVRQRFEQAARGVPVRIAAQYGDPKNPLRVLRTFLPPAEGGVDKNDRELRAERELFPFRALPKPLLRIPSENLGGVPVVNWGQVTLVRLFVQFPVPTLRKDFAQQNAQKPDVVMERRRQGQDVQKDDREDLRKRIGEYLFAPVVESMLAPASQRNFPSLADHFLLASRSARDDILRGRYAEDGAATKLVEALEQVNAQRGMAQGERDLDQTLNRWSNEVLAALDQARASGGNAQALARLNALWLGRADLAEAGNGPTPAPTHLPPWLLAVLGATADPLGEEATYLLALCKHEQAERTQVRFDRGQKNASPESAWQTAAEWWQQYLDKYPSRPGAPAARLWLARVREARQDRAGAVRLLRNASGNLSPLEETGRLYRAKLLQEKK